jgi:hypothetical protein
MKNSKDMRSMIVVMLLIAAVAAALVGIGCFGGGDDSPATTTAGGVTSDETTATISPAETGVVVADVNDLSTFGKKDPFVPQAQPTTTRSTTTTSSTSTTLRTTTSSGGTGSTASTSSSSTTPTTNPRWLSLDAIRTGPTRVNYTVANQLQMSQIVGDVVLLAEGRFEVIAIDAVAGTATFRRDTNPDFTLWVGDRETW